MSNDHIKRRRAKLFAQQRGKCHWCGRKCINSTEPPVHGKRMAPNRATLDHLRDRFDPTRQDPPRRGESRYVMACSNCNHKRGVASVRAQPVEAIRARSQPSQRQQQAAE